MEDTTLNNKPSYTATYTPDTLDDDLKKFDKTYNTTSDLRQQLLDKLTPVVMNININTEVVDRDSAAALDSQMGVIKTFTDILNDTDKAIKTKVDMKTRQKEEVGAGQLIGSFMDALKLAHKTRAENSLNASSIAASADSELEELVAKHDIVISEGELRDNAMDLS